MTRLNIVLLLAVVASALYLVHVSYESRRQFVQLERERNEARRLEQEAEKLRLQLRTEATHVRVDLVARERLGMNVATPAVTQYLEATASGVRP
ncbi:MAG: cell division protein FtsL [Pseudomonadota bacterium]|nr:cell division protein FtsL [Pseudomonadota bacterium]